MQHFMTWHIFSERDTKGIVGSAFEWLERHAYDQHDLASKLIRAIPLCHWERHFVAHSPVW